MSNQKLGLASATRARHRINRVIPKVVSLVTFGSGVLNLISLLGGPVPTELPLWLQTIFPLDFSGIPRSVTLLLGFALVLTSIHLWSRKIRAFQLGVVLSAGSVVVHLGRGLDLPEAIASACLAGLLVAARSQFRVRSEWPRLGRGLRRASLALGIAVAYGVAGFWLLEPREFGINFQWWDACLRTLRLFSFLGDDSLIPKTPYAIWFLDSIDWIWGAFLLYAGFALFRPVAYHFHYDPFRQRQAGLIVVRHGRSAQDFFKLWPDKSYFFSASRQSFLAYRVGGAYALVLGDPVGPVEELAGTVQQFVEYCTDKGWSVGFHQVHAEHLPMYLRMGFRRRMKVGEDAIVDLAEFSLLGSSRKEFRNTVSRLERQGFRMERIEAPLTAELVTELKSVSDAWLGMPGHRERQFTLGRFVFAYVASMPVYVVRDPQGAIGAFLNLVPSFQTGLATVDLMRRRPDAPNGIMDFLFAAVFMELKQLGYRRFSLGMAPLAEFRNGERANPEERAVGWLMRRFPVIFRADTLRRFKSKYADTWEPRYDVYRGVLDLPRLGLALRRISEIPEETRNVA